MSAYVISEVDVRDATGFEAYRTIAAKAIAHYGGRYLVRSGAELKKRSPGGALFYLARSRAGSDCGRLRRSRYLHHQ